MLIILGLCFILVTGALILVVSSNDVSPLFFVGFQALLDVGHLAHDVYLAHLIVGDCFILLSFNPLDF